MRRTCLTALVGTMAPFAAQARSVAPAGDDDAQAIIVTGNGLPLRPGTPAYGSVLITRDRLVNSASNRIENVLTDVADFQQFRWSGSRSAKPSAQGAMLRMLDSNASSRTLVLLDLVPMADPFLGTPRTMSIGVRFAN